MPGDGQYLGEISMYGFNFAPRGWAYCAGQLMSIQQNTALFSLLGTQYGGNGQTTFALPDLRGRVPVGYGQSQSGTSFEVGETSGAETVTLTVAQLPPHAHPLLGSSDAGDTNSPLNSVPANSGNLDREYKTALTNPVQRNPAGMGTTGNGFPHENMQPYLVVNICISLQGIFPSRN